MSMLGVELAKHFQSVGFGIYATSNPSSRTIFFGEASDEPDDYVLIVQSASPQPHLYLSMEYPVFDIWVRSPHTDKAYAKLEAIYKHLHRKHHYQLGDWYIELSRALGSIIDVDRDIESGKLLRLSVQFMCRDITLIS